MAAVNPDKRVVLVYGNQGYSVEQAAERLTDKVLGDAPRDFAYHRFDAVELLGAGNAEQAHAAIDEFQLACQSTPFLAEQYLVRLDHAEKVKPPGRAVGNLARALEGLTLYRCAWEGRTVWALEDDLLPDEPREGTAVARGWIRELTARGDGRVVLDPDPAAPDEFLVSQGSGRHVLPLKSFLRAKLKGNFLFADEEGDGGAEPAPSGTAARLHQLLEKLVENPPPGCWLLLTAGATRDSDLSSSLLTRIRKHGTIEKFVTYDDYEPLDWVLNAAKEKGLPLSRPGAAQFIHLIGNDLGQLAQEIEKLSLLFPPGSDPSEEALLAGLHGNSRTSLFWITERLGAKDLDGALSVLEQFLRETPNEHPVLIGILARYFRQLYQIHALRVLGANEKEMASQLKLHSFIAKKLAAQAERFRTPELERTLVALAELDVELKRSSHLTAILLKDFAQAVCRDDFAKTGARLAQRS